MGFSDKSTRKARQGHILMHDFHRNTAEALPELLRQTELMTFSGLNISKSRES